MTGQRKQGTADNKRDAGLTPAGTPAYIPDNHKDFFQNTERDNVFRATLYLRSITILLIIFTVPLRTKLPPWLSEWFIYIAYPLLLYNILFIIFHKRASVLFQQHTYLLIIDLVITIAILQLGGGWRNSYFLYTLSTIILFTIFDGKRGAFISSILLTIAALLKDPSGELVDIEVFEVTDWDMRVGAALFYVAAGFILAYFDTLLRRLESLYNTAIDEIRRRTELQEQLRFSLELHDRIKPIINASLLLLGKVVQQTDSNSDAISKDLGKAHHWMQNLQSEVGKVTEHLKNGASPLGDTCDLLVLAKDEANFFKEMTEFSPKIRTTQNEIQIPIRVKDAMQRFLRESFTNAWRHSGVTTGILEISVRNNMVIIQFTDNGKGFHYRNNTSDLLSLKSRTQDMAGQLEVNTAPGQGCALTLSFPI